MGAQGRIAPLAIVPPRQESDDVIQAYKECDNRRADWIQVELELPVRLEGR